MAQTIIISGFGPAGASLALALVSGGVTATDITIIDREIAMQAANRDDMRILALNPGSRRLLAALGVWTALAPHAHPMMSIRLSDSALDDRFRKPLFGFEPDEPGEPLAHLVPLSLIEATLREGCRAAGIRLHQASQLAFQGDGNGVRVTAGHATFDGALLVAADGAQSAIRSAAGISMHGWAYDQQAIVATIRHSSPHNGEAVQHFLPSGPFAMLPLDEGRSSIVWSERSGVARAILAMDRESQRDEIARRAAGWRGEILALEGISTHPLRLGLARRFIGNRIALVADAAHVVHPLAGQGLNLGFEDSATLAELLVDRMRLGLDPGAPDLLERYQSMRRPAAVAMAMATDGINRLFSNDLAPLRMLRDLGAGVIDRMPGMKARAKQFAAGNGINPPRLFRGEAL